MEFVGKVRKNSNSRILKGMFIECYKKMAESQIQIIAGSLFNIILNLSIIILIFNLSLKRKQIQKIYFVILNSILFMYIPFSLFKIVKDIKVLLFLLFLL